MGILSANPIGAGLGALGVGASIFGAIKSGQANRANEKLLEGQIQENEAFFNNNSNYLETNAAKGVLETARKRLKENNQIVDNTAAVTGGTAEAAIAAKTANNENYSDTVRNLAEVGTRYELQNQGQYRNNLSRLMATKMQLNQQKADNASNLAGNAGDLFSTASSLQGFQDLPQEQFLAGNNPKLRAMSETWTKNALGNIPKPTLNAGYRTAIL